MTITEFLLARLSEDKAAAREAAELAEAPWRAAYGRQVETARGGHLVTPEDEHSYSTDPTDAVGEHIARHDPARVLREVEAKRAIVEAHEDLRRVVEDWSHPDADGMGLVLVDGGECAGCGETSPCTTLRHLSSIYSDHPEFDAGWAL
ncbi:DUF6221 family protein [Nocardioides sp. 31GB23]|uniref:DUF6221 family protein n=1 Tax=Nocardioides sp. 31GB23 TaxID=3156065 RepID=UPI0032AF83F8